MLQRSLSSPLALHPSAQSASSTKCANQKIIWAISIDHCGRDYKVSSVRHNQTVELAWRCQGFLWRKERSTGMKRVQESTLTPTQQEHSILLLFV